MTSEHYDLHWRELAIRARRSSRKFLWTPVPRKLLMEELSFAQCAPSNSNIQPWQTVIADADGARRHSSGKRLILTEAKRVAPWDVLVLPDEFKRYGQELGALVYGAMGIRREDEEAATS